MPLLIDEMAAGNRDHLIDTVAELIAAVLDVHSRLAVWQILAADIGNTRHPRGPRLGPDPEGALVAEDAERFELPVQGRALHADKGRRARNIAAEAGDLGQEVF